MTRLLIIGGGPGGYETAVEAARRGLDVTLVTDGPLGGTCLNEGCIPTKSLIHSCCVKSRTLPEAVNAKNAVVEQLRGGVESLLKGVNVVRGKAQFIDGHSVKAGDRVIQADKIIIATGSMPASLPVPGAELASDSSDLLDLTAAPSRLAIVGGGVIGLEFAGIFHSLGTEVTILEYCQGILPRFDADMAKRLKQQLVRSGIKAVTGAAVSAIRRGDGDSLVVEYGFKGENCTIEADKVLMAVGRRPGTEGVNLEGAGVEYDRKGIKVDARMRTTAPDIYAVGDVTGGMMLAHAASAQGMKALNDITGTKDEINLSCIPAVVFTSPELASVGLGEEDCRKAGIPYTVRRSNYRANGKALASEEAEGCCKVLVGEDDRILGCHILGAHASDLISEATALISLGVTATRAGWVIHAHPTLSEVLVSALRG